jgi:hypothetical protein
MFAQSLKIAAIAASVLCLAAVQPSVAATYGFTNITNNPPASPDAASNLRVDVDPSGANVAFKFYWDSAAPGVIAQVFFDDGANTLLAMSCCTTSGADVVFASGGAPPDLPGGAGIVPPFDADFRDSAAAPAPGNGVNELGDFVTILFSLEGANTFANAIAALNSGALRIGLHVISLGAGEGSDSFINLTPVPLPPALLLFGSAIAGLYLARRRRQATGPSLAA